MDPGILRIVGVREIVGVTFAVEIALDFGRQRIVSIWGHVGHAEQILPSDAPLRFGRFIGHELCLRLAGLGDHDFLPGRGTFDQFGQMRLRLIEIYRVAHASLATGVLTKLTNK